MCTFLTGLTGEPFPSVLLFKVKIGVTLKRGLLGCWDKAKALGQESAAEMRSGQEVR